MEERLKKQMEFLLEVDKENLLAGRLIYQTEFERKMTQNTHGI